MKASDHYGQSWAQIANRRAAELRAKNPHARPERSEGAHPNPVKGNLRMSDEQTMETTAEAVVSGTAATRELDVEKPYLWRVFRFYENNGNGVPVWLEVGSLPHRYGWDAPGPQTIGELSGAGEYMLIHDGRVTFMRIAQTEPRFEEVEDSE